MPLVEVRIELGNTLNQLGLRHDTMSPTSVSDDRTSNRCHPEIPGLSARTPTNPSEGGRDGEVRMNVA
jgi:hypothetical protein